MIDGFYSKRVSRNLEKILRFAIYGFSIRFVKFNARFHWGVSGKFISKRQVESELSEFKMPFCKVTEQNFKIDRELRKCRITLFPLFVLFLFGNRRG